MKMTFNAIFLFTEVKAVEVAVEVEMEVEVM